MKIVFSILLTGLCAANAFTQKQTVRSEILTGKDIAATFGDAEKKDLELIYPISGVYKYSDKSGQFYTILSESSDPDGSSATAIRAVTAKYENGRFINIWEVNDFADKKKEESSIMFWPKYTEFRDYDNDSRVDPVIVYSTAGNNGIGNIRFVIYYKGQKILLRHQDDLERQIQIDKAFYSLPGKLQKSIKNKMELMVKNKQAIFPHDWQNAMENQKTIIKESD
ncbi:MAG: hypothetical protein Q8941_05420 [Bacteroidota bacterium]|nr:hypothetical protein [Bacteroidota bacterium]